MFCTTAGQVYHTAVYVADDLLCTRNGRVPSRPWNFMRMDAMRDFYPRFDETEIRCFRHRNLLERLGE